MKLTNLFTWWKKRVDEDPHFEFTEHNCGLSLEQVRLGRYTMKVLGLDITSHSLSQKDLLYLSYAVGMNPPEYVIEAKLRCLGLSKHTSFTFEQFLHLWRILLDGQNEEELILERAFNFFDKDGNGEISTSEFKITITELGNLLSETEINEFLELMDTNSDGVLDYGEFICLIRNQRPTYMDLANQTSEEQWLISSPEFPCSFKHRSCHDRSEERQQQDTQDPELVLRRDELKSG